MTYTAVDDAGNIIDHTLIEGQMHGAVAQGLGQALLEAVVYDPDNGQLVSGSFMDYCMPRATDMPAFRIADVIVPATTNPLGVKGAGEAGTTASLAAVMNAIADAIPGEAARTHGHAGDAREGVAGVPGEIGFGNLALRISPGAPAAPARRLNPGPPLAEGLAPPLLTPGTARCLSMLRSSARSTQSYRPIAPNRARKKCGASASASRPNDGGESFGV